MWYDITDKKLPFMIPTWALFEHGGSKMIRLVLHTNEGLFSLEHQPCADPVTLSLEHVVAWMHISRPATPTKRIAWE